MQSSRDRHATAAGCASVLGTAAPVFSQPVRPATFNINTANIPKRTAEIPSAVRIPIKSERPVVRSPAIGIKPKKTKTKDGGNSAAQRRRRPFLHDSVGQTEICRQANSEDSH